MRLLFRFFDLFYRPYIDKKIFEDYIPESLEDKIRELNTIVKDRNIFIKRLGNR